MTFMRIILSMMKKSHRLTRVYVEALTYHHHHHLHFKYEMLRWTSSAAFQVMFLISSFSVSMYNAMPI